MIYYDTNQLPEILDRFEERFPLKHRSLTVEAQRSPEINVYPCEEGDIHVCVDPRNTNLALYTLAGVFGYVLAMAADRTKRFPTSIATYDIDDAGHLAMQYLMPVNPSFVSMFIAHMPEMVFKWYEGDVHEALLTAPPGCLVEPTRQRRSPVFDESPLGVEAAHALHREHVFNVAFGTGLIPPPIESIEEPAN